MRTGPGTRYPIAWVYRRAGMPVEVIEEFDIWRKIRDSEGTTGWVHKTMFDGKRSVIIKAKTPQIVRSDHDAESKPVVKVAPSVIAKLAECGKEWCKIQIEERKGWIKKSALWGVYENEVIE